MLFPFYSLKIWYNVIIIMNKWDEIYELDPKYKPLNEVFLLKLIKKIQAKINHKSVLIIG